MSEDTPQPPTPPTPMKKTSAVPLKKETVRVTLKAGPSVLGVPTPPPAPTAGAPRPPAPAPTIALRSAPAAPTIALRPPGSPIAPGAPSIVPLQTTRPATGPLPPPATVPLPQRVQQLGPPTAPTMSTIGTIATSDDDEPSDTIPTVLSILAFGLSLAVLALALMTWTQEHQIGDLFN